MTFVGNRNDLRHAFFCFIEQVNGNQQAYCCKWGKTGVASAVVILSASVPS
jgi:hypothetical protein